VERGVATGVDGGSLPVVGGDVVAGRLAEDMKVAFARRDRQRAEAMDLRELAVDVEAEREQRTGREPLLLRGARAADPRRAVEVCRDRADEQIVGRLIAAEP